ncbi:MAG: hypothetical protein ACR2GP_15255 [Burkholderiaceae bacterium]
MIAFGVLSTLAVVPLMNALSHVGSPFTAFLLIISGLTAVSFYTSISGLVKAELFPTEVRALGFTYGIANAIFGGSAEYGSSRPVTSPVSTGTLRACAPLR